MIDNNSQSVSWDVGNDINSANAQARNAFSEISTNGSSNIIDTLGKYNIVGININAIDEMRFAIRVYVENIESHLNSVQQDAMDTYAFKGQYANAISEYVQAVCDVVKSLTSQLLAFSDKLVDIKNAYQEKDVNLSSSINSAISNTQSGVNYYNESR